MRHGVVLALLVTLAPSVASACTWCVSSAFGDRTFSWPYVGLLVAPFLIGSTIAVVIWWGYRRMGNLDSAHLSRQTGSAPSVRRRQSSALDKEMT